MKQFYNLGARIHFLKALLAQQVISQGPVKSSHTHKIKCVNEVRSSVQKPFTFFQQNKKVGF